MQIIPAIDLIDGKCVRLSQGDYSKKTAYYEDPLDAALKFEDAGIQRLHLVDLDGAKAKKIVNSKVLERIASKTKLHIDFGGGLRSDDDLRIAFECGARQITGGSVAIKDPELFLGWLQKFGPEKIILGADTKEGKIAVSGWEEKSELSVSELLKKYMVAGVSYSICTDVARDGMLSGPSYELYKDIMQEFPGLHLIASGGIASLDDLIKLKENGLYGAIFGKAFYEGRIMLKDLKQFID